MLLMLRSGDQKTMPPATGAKFRVFFLRMAVISPGIWPGIEPGICGGRYTGGSLFDVLDNTDPLPRDPLGPFRMSVIDKYKDMGTIAMGKSEAGIVRKGDRLYVMPNK